MYFLGFGQYMNASRIFIGMFEIDIPGYEAVLHHQNGINQFAGSRHPHLVSGLAFG